MEQNLPVRNARQVMDGLALLRRLPDGCAALAVFDPQYRALLNKLGFGNEGISRQKRRASLQAMSDETIEAFVAEIGRVLAPSGHMILWTDKFSIGTGRHLRWFGSTIELAVVDLLTWNKMRMGMGKRSRSVAEFAVIAQKFPKRAAGFWTDHSIRDCWDEKVSRAEHPHAKPPGLTDRMICALTKPGDLVVDPCAGGYGVLTACQATGRDFVGCDLN